MSRSAGVTMVLPAMLSEVELSPQPIFEGAGLVTDGEYSLLVDCGVCGVGPGVLAVLALPFTLSYCQPCFFSMCCLQFESRFVLNEQKLQWKYRGFGECLSLM